MRWMLRRKSKAIHPSAAAVAQKGIRIGSARGPRSKDGTRFPEQARLSAQRTIRAALRKLP